jgi:hypothetical protein
MKWYNGIDALAKNTAQDISELEVKNLQLSPGLIEIRAIDYQTQYINIKKEEDTKEELVIKYLESYNKL